MNRSRIRTAGEAGHTSVEVVAWTGVLILGITLLVQALVAGLGALACQAVAGHALQTTRISGGTTTGGDQAADDVLAQLGGRLLRSTDVRVTRTPASSTVTVTATALVVVPGLRIPLSSTAEAPTEPDLERP